MVGLNRPQHMVHGKLLVDSMTQELGVGTSAQIHTPKVLVALGVSRLVNHAQRIVRLVKGDIQVLEAVALDLVPGNVHRPHSVQERWLVSTGIFTLWPAQKQQKTRLSAGFRRLLLCGLA